MFLRLSIFISRINLAKAQRIDSFIIMNSVVNFLFANKLEQLGIIRGFEVEDEKLRVYMKFVNKNTPFTKIQMISKSSRRYPITLEKLSQMVDKNGSSIYILSTGLGFLSHVECFTSRCSGDLIAKIYI